jgi:PAS domain S-box-containing protein
MTLRWRLLLQVGLTVVATAVVGTGAVLERRNERRLDHTNTLALAIVRHSADAQELLYHYGRAPAGETAATVDSALAAVQRLADSVGRLPSAATTWTRRLQAHARGMRDAFRDIQAAPDTVRLRAVEPLLIEAHAIVGEAVTLTTLVHAAEKRLDRRLDAVVLVALAALVATVLTAGWWLVERLGGRLSALHDGAMALAGGDLAHRVPVAGTDEIGALMRAFNGMAAEVEGAVRYARLNVEELDAAQKVLQRRVRQQAAVVALGFRALEEDALASLEQDAAEQVAAGLDVEFAEVLARESDATGLRLRAGVGAGATGVTAGEEGALAWFTLRQRGPVVVDDLAAETRFAAPPRLRARGIRSGVSVMIGDPAHPYGVLGAYSASARRFSDDDVAFVQAAANLLAQAWAARAARDAVRESERRYQDLYDNAPALYWSVELATGRILACNRTAADVLGYDRAELIGSNVFDLYDPECHAEVRAGMQRLRTRGAVRDEILAVRRRDGTTLDVSLQATAVRDAAGNVVASRSTWQDISARRRAERALQRSRDRLAQAERVALMGHWHWDADTDRVTWSEGLRRLFGIDSAALEGSPQGLIRLVHPDDRDRVRAWMAQLREGAVGGDTEYRIIRPVGEVRHVFATAEVAVDADGRVTSLLGTSMDVTERRRLEEQLRHVVEHSTNVFYSHTADHVLTYVSPQSREVLDCDPEEALVRWTEFLTDHPDNQAGLVATERAIATGARQPPYELQLRTARGRVIWVEVREAPLVRDGRTVAVVGALTEITQRRQMEDALRRERELLDRTVNNAPVMFVTFDAAGRVLFVNRAWEQVLGWRLGECRAHEDLMTVLYPDPDERRRAQHHMREATGEWADFRTRVRDGRTLDTMWALVRLSDGTLLGIGEDITQRKAAERALIASEERLRLATMAANQGLFDADLRTGQSVVSPEYCRMLGYEPGELEVTHRSWLERMHPDDRQAVARRLADYLEGRADGYTAEFRQRTRDGAWKWILSVGKIVEWDGGRPVRFLGTHTDITARKQAEDELRASRERLRELAFAQEQAREAERGRMARELHDEMGQALTGFKMDLSWLRDRIPEADHAARTRAAEALELVNAMVDVVRRMSGELRPGVLDDLGLGPAIRWQVREFQRRSGLTTRLAGLGDLPEMDPERALAVFRIVQEALTNVARHARATAVEIGAVIADGRLRLEIRDDGRGIPPTAPNDRAPLGILGMQERAAAWGGTVSVGPATPAGTVVVLEMPVEVPAAAVC